jgi:hypothetical protein
LYKGIRRVDIFSELHTNPNMQFRALAELEVPATGIRAFRDFPFGEEEGRKEQFSALNYVRIESPGFTVLLAHGGTQQFFCVRNLDHVVLRNMIARLTLKGSYQWHWSLTTGTAFTPAASYRFAEASWGPIVQQGAGLNTASQSWVTVNDPAVVVFRVGADSDRMTIWLMNYSAERKRGILGFSWGFSGCQQCNLEGKPLAGVSPIFDPSAKRVEVDLAPWEIAALELTRG